MDAATGCPVIRPVSGRFEYCYPPDQQGIAEAVACAERVHIQPLFRPRAQGEALSNYLHAASVVPTGIGKVEPPWGMTATAGSGTTLSRAARTAESILSKPIIPQASSFTPIADTR